MAIVITNDQYYSEIAAAIRSKNGTDSKYTPSEMAEAIQEISGSGEISPPADGKTRLYISIPASSMEGQDPPRNAVPLRIQQSISDGVIIDWGDGTDLETFPGTGTLNTTHTYTAAGDYIISLDPQDGCTLGLGSNTSTYCVMGARTDNYNAIYRSMLKKAFVGKNVTSIGNYAFSNCYSLASITILEGVTSIGSGAFSGCYSLASITIPAGITSISSSAFANCYSLASITILEGVASIGSGAFSGCYGVKEYYLPATPPALADVTAFTGIADDCIMYISANAIDAYKAEINWPTYAGYMQEKPE